MPLAGRNAACNCFLLGFFYARYVWTLSHREKTSGSADTDPSNAAKEGDFHWGIIRSEESNHLWCKELTFFFRV